MKVSDAAIGDELDVVEYFAVRCGGISQRTVERRDHHRCSWFVELWSVNVGFVTWFCCL